MKALSVGNVFSRYYWEKYAPQIYKYQRNQNSSLTPDEELLYRRPNRLNSSRHRKRSGGSRSRSRNTTKKTKRGGTRLISQDVVEEKIEIGKSAPLQILNRTYSSPDKVSDFCSLFRFYPSLIPSDGYRETNEKICNSFTKYLENTLSKILSCTKNEKIFRSREFLRFTKDLEMEIDKLYDKLFEFFETTPFCCPNGVRFSSIKNLFEHKSCLECKELEKPHHVCQCTNVFDNHEDWVNHVFNRKGPGCQFVLLTFYFMHDRYVMPNPHDNTRIFFCYGCYRKTTNFIDLYFHMTYCPKFEIKLLKNCTFCTKKARQIYEATNCHKLRNSKSNFSLPNQPSPTNYIKLLSKYYKITQPHLLSKPKD